MTSNKIEFDDQLEQILTEYSRRLRDGEGPSIEEYSQRYPELSDLLQELLPTVSLLEQKREKIPSTISGRWKIPRLEKLGEFEMIREIGRGGMGVVYEARQQSLDRRVAVKVLPEPVSRSPNGLLRFQREAKAAARLHHAGIVSVLGTGQVDETAYIVMQFVDGVGLDRVNHALAWVAQGRDEDGSPDKVAATIAKRMLSFDLENARQSSSDLVTEARTPRPGKDFFRNVARLGMQYASALQHAHEHQVLHRDIKPSNLLVDRHGAGWIADFGLARILEDNDASLTHGQGGTPRYMAPEQQSGSARAGTDIFCLGLSIYELLLSAGQGSGEPVPLDLPLAPIRIALPGIPTDLEKIVFKAVESESDDRYRQASDMAEDFRRFLDNEPIQVEKARWSTRTRRWARRNPQLAGLMMLVSFLVAAIATVSTVNYFNERDQRRRTESALHVAMTTLDTVYQRLAPMTEIVASSSDEVTFREPQLSQSSASLLNELLSTWDELATIVGDDRQLQLDAAIAEFRVGEIHRRMGEWSKAQSHLKQAVIRLLHLRDNDQPDLDAITLYTAQAYVSLGIVNSGSRLDSDREYFLDAIQFAEDVEERNSKLVAGQKNAENKRAVFENAQFEKARAHFYLGRRLKSGHLKWTRPEPLSNEEQSRNLDSAIYLLEQWPSPPPSRVSDLLALCYNQRAEEFNDKFTNLAIDIQQKLVNDYPSVQEFRTNLADMYSQGDPRHLKPSDYPEAIRRLTKSIEIVKSLDQNEVRNGIIWQHDHHKLSMLFNKVAENAGGQFDEFFLDQSVPSAARKQSSHNLAIMHAREALKVQSAWASRHFDSALIGKDLEQVWLIRFSDSLASALRARNQPGDEEEADQIVARITTKFDCDLTGTHYETIIKQALNDLKKVSGTELGE